MSGVKEPTPCSQRVGDALPGVVVYLSCGGGGGEGGAVRDPQ